MPYVFAAFSGLFGCVYAFIRRGGRLSGRIFFKTAASTGFVLLCVSLQMRAEEPYYSLILTGLGFSLAGDALLLFTDRSSNFLVLGAVCFMVTHAAFSAAFITKAPLSFYDAAIFAALLISGAGLYTLRGVRLQKLGAGVFVYVAVLCAMTARALSLLFLMPSQFASFAASGAALFAVSDALLAFEHSRGRFVAAAGAASTLCYYSGQILIALTVAL